MKHIAVVGAGISGLAAAYATLTVHDERFFLRALTGSDIGLGESFHGRRLDDAGARAPGAAEPPEPSSV